VKLSQLVSEFEKRWPKASADEWDRVGLTVGNPASEVSSVLVAVDLTEAVIDEAVAKNCQVILTHHPALLRGVSELAEDQLKGRLVTKLIVSGIANFAAHTNADVQTSGASSVLARLLKLQDLKPISKVENAFGHGVIGALAAPLSLREFAKTVSSALPATGRKIAYSGNYDKSIQTVAICSGAGDSFLPAVLASKADVYITSDLRHHPSLDATQTPRQNGALALIDVSHWASESLWVSSAIEELAALPHVAVVASEVITDPWTEEVF